MKNIAFTVTVPEELLVSYIESANIGYWGDIISWDPETLIMTVIEDEFLVDAPEDSDRTVDWDPKNVLVVERRHWELALQLSATSFPITFKDLMSDSGDMYTGDILIQLACFGEEKYA